MQTTVPVVTYKLSLMFLKIQSAVTIAPNLHLLTTSHEQPYL